MRAYFIGAGLLACLLLGFNSVQASCGAASCPIDTITPEKTDKGDLRLDFSYQYIDQNQPRIGMHKASVGEIPGHHDEVSTLNMIRTFALSAGLTRRLSLDLSMPFIHREHQHIHNHMGTPILESWDFEGMGDLQAMLRTAIIKPEGVTGTTFSLLTGVRFPTGRDEALNAEGDDAEPTILPSNNAYALIAGGSFLFSKEVHTLNGVSATMPLFLSSTYQWNQPGIEEYRIGNCLMANMGVTYPMFPKLGFITQVNLKVARHDDQGSTFEEVGKTGGTYIFASPGFQLTMSEGLSSYIIVQLPVYQRVNEIQLTSAYNFLAGLSYRFSVLN